jgi:hypothetical protein
VVKSERCKLSKIYVLRYILVFGVIYQLINFYFRLFSNLYSMSFHSVNHVSILLSVSYLKLCFAL